MVTQAELVDALAAEHQLQAERLDTVHSIVSGLATDVARLLQERADAPTPPCWVDLDAQAAAQAWTALRTWLDTVLFTRYPHVNDPDRSGPIPPCWYQHPTVVEELSALHTAWCGAYRDPKAQSTAGTEWHRRLDEACGRIQQHVSCESTHQEDTTTGLDSGFDKFVMADVLARPERLEDPE